VLLVLLGLTGSAFLAGFAFLMGFNTTGKFDTTDKIKAQFKNEPILAVAIAQDQRAALVQTSNRTLFVIRILGDKYVKRQIKPSDIADVAPGHVRISTQDLGFPALDFWCAQSTLNTIRTPNLSPSVL
jgi:hypothetical protein